MLKRTDRRDEERYDVMSNGKVVGHLRLSAVAPAVAMTEPAREDIIVSLVVATYIFSVFKLIALAFE
jgi:hypothetical protein